MQLPYFFEPTIHEQNQSFIVSEETSKHCIQVLRMKRNEQLNITNGKGLLATATIVEENKKNCLVKIDEIKKSITTEKKICIAISLLKNTTRFEWFLEKATEIGVAEIIPLLCKRTEKEHFRFDRMNGILIAAMLQSQQTFLPILHQPKLLEQCIQISNYTNKLIAHCQEGSKQSIKAFARQKNIQILIGPEGDFTEAEIAQAIQHKFIPVNLGTHRLRTETAGITAAIALNDF
jgi:16S rRNA (uracil1498-N3)-methyltransferase